MHACLRWVGSVRISYRKEYRKISHFYISCMSNAFCYPRRQRWLHASLRWVAVLAIVSNFFLYRNVELVINTVGFEKLYRNIELRCIVPKPSIYRTSMYYTGSFEISKSHFGSFEIIVSECFDIISVVSIHQKISYRNVSIYRSIYTSMNCVERLSLPIPLASLYGHANTERNVSTYGLNDDTSTYQTSESVLYWLCDVER